MEKQEPERYKDRIICGNCLDILPTLPESSVDLVFSSPPYGDSRVVKDDPFPVYRDQEWVDWMVEVYRACLRVCRGLVAFVVHSKTQNYRWTALPSLLEADLHRAGFNVRNPPIYSRIGVPGSGGPDWLRADYERIVCVTHPGRLPWSDNTACGHDPRWPVGGKMSHRTKDGMRVSSRITKPRGKDGKLLRQVYKSPEKCNPGNIIHCNVGGGVMGSRLCHVNEAPFAESLAEFFIKSFCPPEYCHDCGYILGTENGYYNLSNMQKRQSNIKSRSNDRISTQSTPQREKECPRCRSLNVYSGIVLDPFSGSGTTAAMAKKLGRHYIAIDIRQSQVDLTNRRLAEVTLDVDQKSDIMDE